MDWEREKHDWPMAAHSRFVRCPPHIWHVQEHGTGPLMLLLHGAGGATQSWRHLFPILAGTHRVVAIDLPGQGFSRLGARGRCGLARMAEDIATLCIDQGWAPTAIIGHSAGGAIALDLAIRLPQKPRVIGINAALARFKGVAGFLFPLMAKTLAAMPLVADLFTATNRNPRSVQRLIDGTGSHLPPEDLRYYRRLVGDRDHVNATLSMMAQWDLGSLLESLPKSGISGLLIAAEKDRAVPPETSASVAEKMPGMGCVILPGRGHLVHEEDARKVADLILGYLGTD